MMRAGSFDGPVRTIRVVNGQTIVDPIEPSLQWPVVRDSLPLGMIRKKDQPEPQVLTTRVVDGKTVIDPPEDPGK